MGTTKGQYLVGKMLGTCVLEKLLGHGGSSAVFLAQQDSPRRKVAVKVFLPSTHMNISMQRQFYRRFLHEAEAASKLSHAHILPIYSYGEQDGLPYIVMPYMADGTLSEYMTRRAPLSLEEAQWYLDQIASALDYAHAHGYVHCDVKPANILLDSNGYAMLSDFGIARLAPIKDEKTEYIAPMAPELVMGTPDFISPEQALGNALDGRSDIYSLGVTLFYLLTGRPPFKADAPIARVLQHVYEPPPLLSSRRIDITPAIDQIMLKALAKDPAARYQTAQQLSTAFAEAIEVVPGMTSLVSKPLQEMYSGYSMCGADVRPWLRRGNLLHLVGVIALFLLLMSGCWATMKAVVPSMQTPDHVQADTVLSLQHMAADRLANANDWPVSSTFFYDNQQHDYHILNKSAKGVALALYNGHQFENFRLSVTMAQVQNTHKDRDYYGVVFRCSSDQSHYYLFEIVSTGQFDFLRYDGSWKHLTNGIIPPVESGKSITVSIEAYGNTFVFSINGKPVGLPVKDTSPAPLRAGQVGLYVEDQGEEVAFSRLYIEALS